MTARVIVTPQYPSEAAVRCAAPVSARTWQNVAQNVNYALGHGMQVVPLHTPQTGSMSVPKNSNREFHFRVEPRAQAMARVWSIVAQPSGVGRGQYTITAPAGTGTSVVAYASDRDTMSPVTYVEYLSAQSAAETDLSIRIAVANAAADQDLQVLAIGCFEIPRSQLAQNATDYGVDIETLGHRQPIYDATSAYVSVSGVSSSLYQARQSCRRSFLQQSYGSDTTTAWSTTSTSYADVTEGAVPMLNRYLYNGDNQRPARFKVYARHSAGGVSCSVRLTMSSSAGTTTATFTPGTSFAWWPASAASIDIDAEDMDDSDGIRSGVFDNARIEAKLDSASGTFYIGAVSVWESATDS